MAIPSGGFAPRMVCAADWQAECVETMLRTNPKALLAVSAFSGITQYELPFIISKNGDEVQASIQIQDDIFVGRAKSKKLAEVAAAEAACLELNKRGLLRDPSLFMEWGVNPKQTLMNSGLYPGKSLPVTITSAGPGHAKVFVAELTLPLADAEPFVASGKARSKSEAEKMCCLMACKKLFEDSLLVKGSACGGVSSRAEDIHQQNELPTIIELDPGILSRLEDALPKLTKELENEAVMLPCEINVSDSRKLLSVSCSKSIADEKQTNDLLVAERIPIRLKRMECRGSLPISSDKEKILQAIDENQVIVLTGDTGSGKSTQVPQFILEEAESKGLGAKTNIVVTQPRRIAAMSLSERVAWERGEALGVGVGYSIRLDSVLPRNHGSILFCTAGILVWHLQANKLEELSHIIVDEVHERDIATDCLLTIIRELLSSRPTLKLIIMSATLDASIFISYFSGCPHISIPGKSFPVKVFFLEEIQQLMGQQEFALDDSESDVDCELSASVISWISNCFAQDNGAILCFLPGWAAIATVRDRLSKDNNLAIVPFHSKLSTSEQRLAFSHAPEGKRKVVLSTNIAETSVTIDDVIYVVDCGKMKEKHFKPSRNLATLKIQWTSQACALQRQGRAGRVRPGFCFRLYTKNTFLTMSEHQTPEMQRLPLEELCLQIKALMASNQDHDISAFLRRTIDPPSGSAILAGVYTLKRLGAIDDEEHLTRLGRIVARLGIEPRYGKVMVFGAMLGCQELLTVAAAACFKTPFDFPDERKEEAKSLRASFASRSSFGSDQLAIVEVFDKFLAAESAGEGVAFCEKNFLSPVIMKLIKGMRRQFEECLKNENLLAMSRHNLTAASSRALARCLLVCGLSPNIARTAMCKDSKGSKRISHRWRLGFCAQSGRVLCHPSSVVEERNLDPQKHFHMVFEEKVRSPQTFVVRGCNLVPPIALIVFSGIVKERKEAASKQGWTVLEVESWLEFHVEAKAGEVLLQLREAVGSVMLRWIEFGRIRREAEEEVMQLLCVLLDSQTSKMLSASVNE